MAEQKNRQKRHSDDYVEGLKDGAAAAAMNPNRPSRYSDRLFSEMPRGDYKSGYSEGWAIVAGDSPR